MIIEGTPKEYRLRILAEESSELSQAALKLIRAIERDTPVSEADALANLIEEAADVMVALVVILSRNQWEGVKGIMRKKYRRWSRRLCGHYSTNRNVKRA